MNLIFFTHAAPQFLPQVMIDPEEIICGQHYRNWRRNGRWKYITSPRGLFDAQSIFDKLPPSQIPELIVVHADATLGCLPQNFPQGIPRILLVGDTHHLEKPIQNLISYATQIGFDAVIVWNRQHAHFFKQFGIPNVFWMPGLVFAIPELPAAKERRNQMCFFGQIGPYHPRRNRIIKELQQKEIPIVGGKLPRLDSLELAARSLVSLNISLNGEWNLRVFETTIMGALLLTDQLSPHTGLDLFFQNGVSMLTYRDMRELIQQIGEISKHPQRTREIATKGQEITKEYFSFEARRKTLDAFLNDGETFDTFRLTDEPRCQLPAVAEEYKDSLVFRLQLYEFLQELHRTQELTTVCITEGVHPLVLSDAGDLLRLKQILYIDEQEYATNWIPAMSELNVNNLQSKNPGNFEAARGEVLVTSLSDMQGPFVQQAIQKKTFSWLVISDWFTDPDKRYEAILLQMGYESQKEKVFGLFKTV